MATKQMKRYNVLLTKQTACRNYLIFTQQKLEDSLAYNNIVAELDKLTVYFQKEFGETIM